MRSVPSGLLTLLNSGPTELVRADLFTFTLINGNVLRWTDYDGDVTLSGNTWLHDQPIMQRSRIKWSHGTDVDTLELDVADPGNFTVGGTNLTMLQALALRYFDGATVELDRVFMSPGGTWQGPMNLFTGQVGEITQLGRLRARLTVNSRFELLSVSAPLRVIQPSCRWTLFDAGCTLNRSSFATSGSVSSGSNKSVLQTNLTKPGPFAPPSAAPSLSSTSGHYIPAATWYVVITYVTTLGETLPSPEASIVLSINNRVSVTSPSNPGSPAVGWNCYVGLSPGSEMLQNDTPIAFGTGFTMPDYTQGPNEGVSPPTVNTTGWFDLGYLTFTTGANAGTTWAIDTYGAGGVVTLRRPLFFAPSTGDAFTAYPGCSKTLTVCNYKYSNLANFGGFPFIPTPETAI